MTSQDLWRDLIEFIQVEIAKALRQIGVVGGTLPLPDPLPADSHDAWYFRGRTLVTDTPAIGDIYQWDGTNWILVSAPVGEGEYIDAPLTYGGANITYGGQDIIYGTFLPFSTQDGPVIQDEGTGLTLRSILNFVGAGVTAADDAANSRTNVTILGGGGGGSAHTIQDEGTGLAARTNLNFVGDGVTTTDDSGNDATVVTIPGGGAGGGLYSAYLCFRDEKATGTNGGTFTSGAWQTRDLNTEHADTGNHASLASNQITLAAGTYRALIHCPGFMVNWHQARLQDVTNTVTLLVGTPQYNSAGNTYAQTTSVVAGRFTLAAPAVLEVQHRSAATRATDGFGRAASFTTEIYTIAEFFKEA